MTCNGNEFQKQKRKGSDHVLIGRVQFVTRAILNKKLDSPYENFSQRVLKSRLPPSASCDRQLQNLPDGDLK